MPRLGNQNLSEHVAAFHVSDHWIVSQAAAFLAAGLDAGERAVGVATRGHWNAIAKELEVNGVALEHARAAGRVLLIEADQLVESLTVAGRVDAFRARLQPLIEPGVRLRIYGELVSRLAQRDDVDGALAVERVVHELAQSLKLNVLCGYDVAGARRLRTSEIERIQTVHDRSVCEEPTRISVSAKPAGNPHSHAVRFYQDAQSLARIVSQFLAEGLSAGLPAVLIARPEHRDVVLESLSELHLDVSRLRRSNDLILADAEQTLSKFMVGGMPDAALFQAEVVPLIERACRRRVGGVVRVYGEMVDVLWKGGHTDAAIKLETLWNQLAHSREFALLCGYAMGHFYKAAAVRELHDLHTHVSSDKADGASRTH